MPAVTWIAMTPVKGLRLHHADAAQLDFRGLEGDRAFFLGGGVDRGPEGAATLLGTGSLAALGAAAGVDEPVDPRRFRMTFGIEGLAPHEEDGWIGREVRLGGALLRVGGNVGRCAFTTRNA